MPSAGRPPEDGSPDELLAWCRLAFDVTPIGIAFVTADRRPLAMNPAMCRILGLSPLEILHTSIDALTHPDDRHLHVEPHRRLLAVEVDRYRIEKRYLRPDGPAIWVALHVVLVRDADGEPEMVISQCEDISARVAAEADLQAERNRFAALVKRSSDLMLLLRSTGHIAYASPASERVWGYPAAAVQGLHFADFVHPDDLRAVAEAIAATAAAPGSSLVVACRVIDFDGVHRHVEATASNWLDEPDVDGLVINVRDVTDRVATLQQLTWQAHHDPLTGLANRTRFVERLEELLEVDDRGPDWLSVLFLDLDDFKAINDEHGHAAGDHVLTVLGRRIDRLLRDDDLAGRFGGDEFVVLVHPAGVEVALGLAERLAAALGQPVTLPDRTVLPGIKASIGIAAAGDQRAGELLHQADQALYAAKRAGRDRIEVYR